MRKNITLVLVICVVCLIAFTIGSIFGDEFGAHENQYTLEVGHVYDVIDTLVVVLDIETKAIKLTKYALDETGAKDSCLEVGKRYRCISVNLGDGDKKKLVISEDTTSN